MIHIALCTDENYAIACLACTTSIFENNKSESISLNILTNGLSEKTEYIFKELSQKYKQQVKIINISSKHFLNLKISNRYRESIYYRFLIPDLINEEKVLYIDSDTIIINDIKDLWETNLNNLACGVIEDQSSDDIRIHNRIGIDSPYFNSGVLLINTEYWKNNKIKYKLIEFIYNHPYICLYPDQDALNIILHNQVKYLPYKYNYQEILYTTDFRNLFIHRSKWHSILNDRKEVKIIHFTGNIKPWHVECRHPQKDIFLKYIRLSGLNNFKPWHYYNIKSRIIIYLKKFIHNSSKT